MLPMRDDGLIDGRTSENSATKLLICEKVSLAILPIIGRFYESVPYLHYMMF